jgi:hypothetical protein
MHMGIMHMAMLETDKNIRKTLYRKVSPRGNPIDFGVIIPPIAAMLPCGLCGGY